MRDYLRSERGAAGGEYALLLAMFGATVAVAAIALSGSIGNSIQQSADLFSVAAADSAGPTTPGQPKHHGKPDNKTNNGDNGNHGDGNNGN